MPARAIKPPQHGRHSANHRACRRWRCRTGVYPFCSRQKTGREDQLSGRYCRSSKAGHQRSDTHHPAQPRKCRSLRGDCRGLSCLVASQRTRPPDAIAHWRNGGRHKPACHPRGAVRLHCMAVLGQGTRRAGAAGAEPAVSPTRARAGAARDEAPNLYIRPALHANTAN